MNPQTMIIAAVSDPITAEYVLGYVGTAAIGFGVAWFGQSLRGSAAVRERMERQAEQLVTEKFDTLSSGVRARLDGHDDRLVRIEQAIERFVDDRHNEKVAILNQLAAIRLLIAERAASKEQVEHLQQQITQLAALTTKGIQR